VVILPQELTSVLNWAAGDSVDANIVEGNLVMVRAETLHGRAMKIAKKGMERYRTTLENLAKR
jgi:bifunctional DNA-binding transcriptional regulator/antitoxin component of YhaV-PrlF toxin-antitoxin module